MNAITAPTRKVRVLAVGGIRAGVIRMQASPMSDDLWTALHQHRPTACQVHRSWAAQCAGQHGLPVAA